MRKPETIEKLYLDFDGFFASVMQQAMPKLRGRPVGVIPFETSAANSTVVIACSKEAKAAGCKNVMRVPEALRICPDMVLVTQRPDFSGARINALLNEIRCEIPIETVKSIDELACKLDRRNIADPAGLARRIKRGIAKNIGKHITCSIGFAANRLLAKIACKVDKPNGVTVWLPEQMPEPLLALPLETMPGIGQRIEAASMSAGIAPWRICGKPAKTTARALGKREWRAHVVRAPRLRPSRSSNRARDVWPWPRFAARLAHCGNALSCSRLLLTKAARRMRRDGYYAGRLCALARYTQGAWFGQRAPTSCGPGRSRLPCGLGNIWDEGPS